MKTTVKINVLVVLFTITSSIALAQNDALKILKNGNVGINTNTPSQKLDVNGSIVTETTFLGTGAHGKGYAAFGFKSFGDKAKSYSLLQSETGETFLNSKAGKSIVFRLGNVDKMILKSSGNFGIGTTSPFEKLHVNGNITVRSSSTLYGALKFGTTNKTYENNWAGLESYNTGGLDQSDLRFYTSYGARKERVRISEHGNIGIGVTNPKIKLEVAAGNMIGSSGDMTRQHAKDNQGIKVSFGHQGGVDFVGMRTVVSKGTNGPDLENGHVGNAGDIRFDTWECNTQFSREVMRINGRGNVGIGTNTPINGKLEVNGVHQRSTHNKYAYLVYKNKITGKSDGTIAYSIYASGRIAAAEFNAFSDIRIKNILGVTNNAKDLETLSKIEITDYKLIDSIEKGNEIHKKVIAQQVKQVYPQAVDNNITEIIPNIYEVSTIKKGWITLKEQKLKVGDKVKLIFLDEETIVNVTEIKGNTVKVDNNKTGQVFVYGKEVNDFHTVDYEAISMLNVSATQALLKRIEQLESDKTSLAEKQKETETKLTASISRIERLEKLFTTLE